MSICNLDPAEAGRIVRHRRCSDCWETLVPYNEPNTGAVSVSCVTPGCPCRGHVAAEYVTKALAESRAKRWEAEHALGESGAVEWIPKPVRRAAQAVLAELGY